MRILPLVALALLGAGCDFDAQLEACAEAERCVMTDAPRPTLRYPHNGAGLGTSGATTPLGMTPTRPYFAWDFDGDETWSFRFQLTRCDPGHPLVDCPFPTDHSDPIPDIPGTTYGLDRDLLIGSRYWWRVRACHTPVPGKPCGPWSDARYFDVGRPEVLPNDLSVSGRADLVVGQGALSDPLLPQTLYLFHGSNAGPTYWKDLSVPTPGLATPVTYDLHVTGAGDLNGDGYSDLAVAYQPNFAGAVEPVPIRVFLGSSAGPGTVPTITLGPQADGFGLPLGRAGDVNGDGYSDLAVCQATQKRAIVYFGGQGGPSNAVAMQATLSVPNADLGKPSCAFAALLDVNADGYDDIAVSGTGQVSVFRGREGFGPWEASVDVPIPAGATDFGASMAGGDFNGDGYGDLVVSGTNDKGYLYLGGPGWFTGQFPLPIAFDLGPGTVAAAGDVNNDGFADLVAGGGSTGQVRIFLGQASGAPRAAATITNTGINNFGVSFAGAGDVTGDYFDDVVVGGTNGAVVYRGSASENDLGVNKDTVSPRSSNQFGSQLAPAY